MDAQTSPLDLPEGVPGHVESDLLTRGSKIAENAVGFFALLAEWSRVEMPSPANNAWKPAASQTGEARNER
jgi:hypothetical protein